jgi:ribosomal protein L33
MAKKGDKRKLIGLVSEESGERIYYTSKNTQNTTEKLSLKKVQPQAAQARAVRRDQEEPWPQRSKAAQALELFCRQ